jgi:hypothetical protein
VNEGVELAVLAPEVDVGREIAQEVLLRELSEKSKPGAL